MGLIFGLFYIKYIAAFIIISILVGYATKRWVIAWSILGIAFAVPVLDIFIPKWSFDYYCSKNLKHEYNGAPVYVDGFYSENTDGLCRYCYPYLFLEGYKYLEGKIDKNIKSNVLFQNVNDIHGSLYRFSIISNKTEKADFKCNSPDISYTAKGYRDADGITKTHYLCIKAEKLIKIQSAYKQLESRIDRIQIPFGEVSKYTRVIKTKKNETLYFHNSYSLKARRIISVNEIFRHNCAIRKRREKTSITDILRPFN